MNCKPGCDDYSAMRDVGCHGSRFLDHLDPLAAQHLFFQR
jgi:hypothetical protein